jgi:GH15 family glucan-1,4-alpha-glucosidase
MERGVDPVGGHFVQHYGSPDVDASLLKLPLIGFVDASDPRMLATVDRIRRDLAVEPSGLIRRFRDDGDTGRPEGVFLLCTTWLVEVLAMQGSLDDAITLFEEVLSLGNDVGLFAEEYDVGASEPLGNFPQAFTHLGVISAARRLERELARRSA